MSDQQNGLVTQLATKYQMDRHQFWTLIGKTIMPSNTTPTTEQITAFLVVAHQYGLNPFTKEIFAFPSKGGGIQPVVSVDGWAKLINQNPDFDGMEFVDALDKDGNLVSVTCKMHRKGRSHAVEATEYMIECKRDTQTWKQWPRRMLRHKAMIQAARYAFSFAGIIDPDEAERFAEAGVIDIAPEPRARADKKPTQIMLDALENQLHSAFAGDESAMAEYLIDKWGVQTPRNEGGLDIHAAIGNLTTKGDVDVIAGDLVARIKGEIGPENLTNEDVPA